VSILNYKIEGAIRRNRKYFIIFAILWLFIAIVLISPIAHGWYMAQSAEKFDFEKLVTETVSGITNHFNTLGTVISEGAIGIYLKALGWFSIIFFLFFFIGVARSAPKNEYSDIEHGSSDWSTRGEQYKVLSNKKGIILAEDNYLPVDKRGNVNVLVVGRIRFW